MTRILAKAALAVFMVKTPAAETCFTTQPHWVFTEHTERIDNP